MSAQDPEQWLDVRARLLEDAASSHRPPRILGVDVGAYGFAVEAEFAFDSATGKPVLVGVAFVPADRPAG